MPFAVTLHVSAERLPLAPRSWEPFRIGLPVRRGHLQPDTPLHLRHAEGVSPVQVTVQDRWPDGSVRWILLEGAIPAGSASRPYQVGTDRSESGPYHVEEIGAESRAAGSESRPCQLSVIESAEGWTVATGTATFVVGRGGLFGLRQVSVGEVALPLDRAGLTVTAHDGASVLVQPREVRLVRQGACAALFEFEGRATIGTAPLVVFGELEFFASVSTVRVRVTQRNPRAATHPDGHFDLGSERSLRLRSSEVRLPLEEAPGEVRLDTGDGRTFAGAAVSVHQESSGGERWNHHIHMDATRRVPLSFQGFRATVDGSTTTGRRAEPLLTLERPEFAIVVAAPRFWQNFPMGLAADATGLTLGLFAPLSLGLHELQGGEQKTHEFVLEFRGAPQGSVDAAASLDWVRRPRLLHAAPEYYASTGVIHGLVPKSQSTSPDYERLIDSAIEGPNSFDVKRETVDQYGWRHFGDIWGDHEAVFYQGDDGPLVSHYNNQYDPVQGFAFQFLRSADARWWRQMDELAAHVADIDVYHTDEDKSAYNHGLFWHTAHYIDADTSTHRAYPKRGSGGGGPSGGHLYPSGLMLHAYLTGTRLSRATALELADYVITCDDGALTFMKWLSRAPTGVATASGTEHYHGPGRAAGNSINALLEGLKATGDERYARKIDELLRRVFHPATDIASLNLLDAENKWFYMMYAHSLGKYLDWCVDEGLANLVGPAVPAGPHMARDTYEYARACFLHLMRWAVEHERPYLDKPEELEYPTETWAAQDMRKCDVFLAAARHAETDDERRRYLEKARFFFDYSVQALKGFETRHLCRPVVLLLSFGWRWFGEGDAAAMPPVKPLPARDCGRPTTFVAQKPQFLKRAKLIVAIGGVAAVVLVLLAVMSYW